ncbi:unnamed protein product [Protopolystoma xenopodis]|uniref:Uncharacterized protein n=1 Tax=Protopolystoma xenopodis TaxID=117903 RepID=A0A3S4ZYJ0_9PLAT|nr:unnamed protein product [Protopolystoma xenopodis]
MFSTNLSESEDGLLRSSSMFDEILATIFPGVQISVSLWKNRRSPFSCDEDKETEELNEEEAGEERASNTAGSSLLPFGRSTIPRKRPCLLAALSRSTSAQATSSQALGAIASSFEPQGAQPMASTLTSAPTSPPGLEDASCCLAVQLHRLLARIHRSAWPNLASLPQPSTCPVQVPARLRAAGALVFPMQRISPAAAPIHAPASAPVAAVSPLAATAETASSVAIATAAVAGFAGPAAAAWVAAGMDAVAAASNATGSGSGRVPGSGTAGTWASLAGGGTAGRIATAPICQV